MACVNVPLGTSVSIEEVVSLHYFGHMNNLTFPGEIHDFRRLVCVDKGEIDVQADDRTVTLKWGSVISHKPDEFHNMLTNGKVAPNLIVIGFICHSPYMKTPRGQVLTIRERESNLLAQIITETRNALKGRMDNPYQEMLVKLPVLATLGAEQLIRHGLEGLIVRLYRRYFDHTAQIRPYRQSEVQMPSGTCQRMIHYIEEHTNEQLTIHQMYQDNLTGRSRPQELFQEYYGRGIVSYLNRIEIDTAKQLIRDNQLNFTEVSNRLGYASVHYSSRQLKMLTDMTPSEYAASTRPLSEKNV